MFKIQLEQQCKLINEFPAAQDSIKQISNLDIRTAELEALCKNDEISNKQKILHKVVSMIHEFRQDAEADQNEPEFQALMQADEVVQAKQEDAEMQVN